MKTETVNVVDRSSTYRNLDAVRMGKLERKSAQASLRDGEMIATALMRAAQDLGAIGNFAEHALAGFTHGVKAIFAKPAKH